MKKFFIMLFTALLLIMGAYMPISAESENRVSDVFGKNTVECDVNTDGKFDIRDLIRIKKYAAGMPVTVNLNVTGVRGDSIANAVAGIKKQLLGVEK